jgi:hypothetical protein
VYYLRPNNNNVSKHIPNKNWVFIKFEKNAGVIFNKISKANSLQQIVLDPVLSPKKETAQVSLGWLERQGLRLLTHSNPNQIETEASKLCSHEL